MRTRDVAIDRAIIFKSCYIQGSSKGELVALTLRMYLLGESQPQPLLQTIDMSSKLEEINRSFIEEKWKNKRKKQNEILTKLKKKDPKPAPFLVA